MEKTIKFFDCVEDTTERPPAYHNYVDSMTSEFYKL